MFIETGISFLWGVFGLAVKATIALLILFRMLRYANEKNGVKIGDMLKKLDEDPRAVGEYYGRRLIAAALVVMGVSLGSL
jgi:Na+/proline symporter